MLTNLGVFDGGLCSLAQLGKLVFHSFDCHLYTFLVFIKLFSLIARRVDRSVAGRAYVANVALEFLNPPSVMYHKVKFVCGCVTGVQRCSLD